MSFRARAVIALGVLGVACGGGGSARSSNAGVGGESGSAGHTPCGGCAPAGAAGEAFASGGGGASGAEAGASGATDAGAAGAADEGGAAGVGEAGAAGASGDSATPSDVTIREISFWQAMRVPLEISGAIQQPNAPLVTGKAGVLRVFVDPAASYRPRRLSVALNWATTASSSAKVILAASQNGDFGTSFNFPLDAADVLANQAYSVVLQDATTGSVLDRYPATGTQTMSTVTAAPTLNVVIVPMIVSGITPDTSDAMLTKFRTRVLSMYPLANLTFTTHAPVTSNVAVGPDAGWDETLDELYALRAQDAPADNVYYFGLFTPAATFADYCVTDCTVGLSQIAGAQEVEYRGAIGLDVFPDGSNGDAADTMAHELGHALGRQHSPCMIGDPTGLYPYPGGKIGVWGFDSVNHELLDPQLYGDVMGYCTPDWISDYTYAGIFDRIKYVNGSVAADIRAPSATAAHRRVLVDAHGGLHWGARFIPTTQAAGEARAVTLLAANGTELGNVAGYYRTLSDGRRAFLALPEAVLDRSAGVAAIRVGTAELSLDALRP